MAHPTKSQNHVHNTKANNTNPSKELSLAFAGTFENPTCITASDVRKVSALEIATGASAFQDLAFGLYFGVLDAELCTPEGIDKALPSENRAVKNERSALKLLAETPATVIRAAWDGHIAGRMLKANARYTKPTLQAMAKLVRDMTSTKEHKAPPVPTAKRVAELIAGKGTAAQVLKAIAAIPAVEKELAAIKKELEAE